MNSEVPRKSDTIKWNDQVTAPLIVPIVFIAVVVSFFVLALIKLIIIAWEKKRRSETYEITDLLPEKSKIIPECIIDDGLPVENDRPRTKRQASPATRSHNSDSSGSNSDLNEEEEDARKGSITGAASRSFFKFSKFKSFSKRKMFSSYAAPAGESHVEDELSEVTTSENMSTSVKEVAPNGLNSRDHDSSNDTNDLNFDEEENFRSSNLDEPDHPIPNHNPLRRNAPLAVVESEV